MVCRPDRSADCGTAGGISGVAQGRSRAYRAYRAIEAAWQAAEQPGRRLADEEADEIAVYLKAMDGARPRRKIGGKLLLPCLLIIAALSGAIWLEHPGLIDDLRADYVTDRGERRSVTLTDGSTVLLDADSALSSDFSAGQRRVRLLRGAAYFSVVPSGLPFVVEAANGEVSVLGTGFEVRLVDEGGAVTLEHGRVAVKLDDRSGQTILEPGQQVLFGPKGVAAVTSVTLDDALAWRQGRYTFYRARLADVVGEIQRYRQGRIIVVSGKLADERVTGSFPLADTDAALASLQASVGFELHRLTNRLTIIGP